MVTSRLLSQALPADPLGQRLWQLFGQNPWDFLEAPTPAPGEKPQWRTVKNYPLRPRTLWRRWQDPDTLIGVRFKSQTYYGLIDIDAGSPYCNTEAIADLRAALETIGITRTLLLRSSHSNGLHLYLPLPETVKTFDLAVALEECLTTQEFEIAGGKLEIFPNPKPYGVEKIIHYNGHRLPLQPGTGSCLLDNDLNPTRSDLGAFFKQWDVAASEQDLEALQTAMQRSRSHRRKRGKRDRKPNNQVIRQWRADLEAEIQEGWSGPGQTNHLLKTIACYGHVFLALQGDDLIAHSVNTATHLPGYQQHCNHQDEIYRRVKAWCKDVEKHYWPLGDDPKRETQARQQPKLNLNHQRAAEARDRVARAVDTLKGLGDWPTKIRARAQSIAAIARCSLRTVYKHVNIWHPDHIQEAVTASPATDPPDAGPPDRVTASTSESLESLPSGLLPTMERSMKCMDSAVLDQKNSPERGVRGELPHFPQASVTPAEPFIAYREAHAAIQRKVQELQWSLEQVRRFLAEHFQGRDRIWELQEHELTTYLYYLQVASLASG